MIDYRQIRAARALLHWSQVDLARAVGMAASSVKSIESATGTARRETLALIGDTFARNGVEFLPASGVCLKKPGITVHDDKHATKALLDDIYTHVQGAQEREVCIIGLDEEFSIETDGKPVISSHIERLMRAGVTERILICEGDTHFLNKPESYRYLPKCYFTRTAPIFIYGDRVAIQMGSLRRRAIIIEARPLAQHMRLLFELLWENAPSPNHSTTTNKT